MENYVCLICGSLDLRKREYTDINFQAYDYFMDMKVIYCTSCGFGESYPKMKPNDIYDFYKNVYREKGSQYYINFNKLIPSGIERSKAQFELGFKYLTNSINENDSFIDIGPGDGSSFETAKFYFKNLIAIELSNECAAAYQKKFGAITYETISDANVENVKIILSSHCFEHFYLNELMLYLDLVKSKMNSNTILIVEVPNDDSTMDITHFDSPHFSFFTKKSLELLFTKKGFEVLFCDTCDQKIDSYVANVQKNLYTNNKNVIQKLKLSSFYIYLRSVYVSLFKSLNINTKYTNKIKEYEVKTYEYGGDRVCLRMVAKLLEN